MESVMHVMFRHYCNFLAVIVLVKRFACMKVYACLIATALFCYEAIAGHPIAVAETTSYTPKSVLSLVVSAEDPNHAKRHLARLAWVAKHRKVKVGAVYVLGLHNDYVAKPADPSRDPRGRKTPVHIEEIGTATVGPLYKHLLTAGVPRYNKLLARKVFEDLDVRYSPTWVVRHRGRDYIFEGVSEPSKLFDRNGNFLRAN